MQFVMMRMNRREFNPFEIHKPLNKQLNWWLYYKLSWQLGNPNAQWVDRQLYWQLVRQLSGQLGEKYNAGK